MWAELVVTFGNDNLKGIGVKAIQKDFNALKLHLLKYYNCNRYATILEVLLRNVL